MASSRRANNKRAFQMIPHTLRRRSASHNVKRVPKRLRRRAAHEMKEDNTPTVTARTRKKTGHMRMRMETARKLKNMAKKKEITEELLSKTPGARATENELRKPPRPPSKFRKRQREKTWLPTHVWHAKRAKMATRWRFAVAESPRDKCYRPTHRASQMRGAVAWDESYFSTLQLKGNEDDIKAVLSTITGKGTALSTLVVAGRRSCETWLYHPNSFPTQPIAPATLIWCAPAPDSPHRQLFIRLHPSAFLEFWTALIPIAKQHSLTLEDLRFEIGSIELTGPAATDTLLSILRPASSPPDSPAALWPQLRSLTNPSALPPGALLGFTIQDPRLCFPPRLPEDTRTAAELSAAVFNVCSTWSLDRAPLTPPALFSRPARTAAVKAQPSQKNINKRKSDVAAGTYPLPLPSDPTIPILLFASRRASPEKGVSGSIGNWTLMLPWKWVSPVWYGLMHTGPTVRFGGVDERRQVLFENGVGCFPDDFPGTRAGRTEEERKGAERRECWEKKPKGKRVEWGSVPIGGSKGEIGDGFVCDWPWLIGRKVETAALVEKVVVADEAMDVDSLNPATISTAELPTPFEAPTPSEPPSTESTAPPPAALPLPTPEPIWNMPAPLIKLVLATPRKPLPPSLSSLSARTLSRGVFTVKLTYVQRGTPTDRARIYRLPADTDLRAQWMALVQKRTKRTQEHPSVPPEQDCIGFVTTGNFSLKEGLGIGVGTLAFEKVFGERVGTGAVGKLCVVRDVGTGIGRLARWEVV